MFSDRIPTHCDTGILALPSLKHRRGYFIPRAGNLTAFVTTLGHGDDAPSRGVLGRSHELFRTCERGNRQAIVMGATTEHLQTSEQSGATSPRGLRRNNDFVLNYSKVRYLLEQQIGITTLPRIQGELGGTR
jgi:hypothetical protein